MFNISGVFSYILNPGTGTIVVEATNNTGTVTEIINGPFTDFMLTNYSVSGIISDGSPVTLSVYFSDDLSCTASFTDVSAVLPTVTSVTGGGIYCLGDPIASIFTDVTGNGPWTVDYTIDGVPQTATGSSNPIDLGNTAGEYIITNVSDAGCSNVATGTQLIETLILPEVILLSGGDTYCIGDSLNDIIADVSGTSPWTLDYTLNGVSMTINSTSNQINLGNIPGNYSLVGVSDSTCPNSASGSQSIIVQALPNVFAGDDLVNCDGDEIILSGSGAQTYTWDNGVTNGLGFIPTSTLTYTVTGTDTNGCINTDDILVTHELLPDVSFIADSTIGCEPWEVVFTNTTPGNIQNCVWDFGDGHSNDMCGPVTNVYENGGLYDVSLTTTSINGCTNSTTYFDFIYVENNPVASFTASLTTVLSLNTQVFFTNTSEGAINYLWSFGDTLDYTNVVHPTYVFPDNTTQAYEVVLIAISPIGCRDTTTKLIQVNQEIIFYIPNSFTPDGDEFNQTFQAIFTAGYDPFDFEMLIYNRWGEIIFETNNSESGWDGTYNGKRIQEGSYAWKIEFKTELNDERMMHTGHLNVLK
jgi:gliding motility-associated-like protein